MTFSEWIASIGDQAAAERLGIPRRTIKAYRLCVRRPRPEKAPDIIERSDGMVDWIGIYGSREATHIRN